MRYINLRLLTYLLTYLLLKWINPYKWIHVSSQRL